MDVNNSSAQGIISRRAFIGSLATAGALLPIAALAKNISAVQPVKTDRPICVFSKHLHWLTIPEMAKSVASLGYDGIDLTVRKGGHMEPAQAATELPKVVAQIRKAGLDVPMMVTEISDAQHPLTEPILKAASQAGIKYYRTAWVNYDPQLGVVKSLEKYKKQFQELSALNQKYNIHGAYQNHSGTSVGAAVWDLWELFKDLDPRWMGVQYDINHATAEGSASWVNDVDLLKNYIRCMDIKDFYWAKKEGKWEHQLVPLGEGMVDFKKYFSLVKQYGISGPLSVHFEYPLGGADQGKKQITIPKEEVFAAMSHDLQTLRAMLKEAGLV
ncbi:sugar phosphate isomerase/epimerase family protein [Adhaeribacter radiodurans]|uniref:Sugar phosphate isomerase/epimerase n=1 Tax=Adhaeribacter radiodurans TaxID=2745197 RepID=A0A7L7LBT6_9BACT|nr:sugar phosphate isomerase/epimerase family protein [Adhaeribacter radiodurans]QMU30207.1 sugar phosphate isomerase/epimerase [Adhaeribacter radiodurans]